MSGDEPFVEIDLASVTDQIISVPTQDKFITQMVGAMEYFFSDKDNSFRADFPNKTESTNFPFKGFILQGPPGSGKTEAVIEAGRKLRNQLGAESGIGVRLLHVNSSNINRSRVGEMETRLQRVFLASKSNSDSNSRTIILFDDIETLLPKRDADSQEWSRSLNGVFFHELDNLITTKTMVIATTNLPEMVDPAVRSRLALRDAPAPTPNEMKEVAKTALPIRGVKGMTQNELLELTAKAIDKHLAEGEPPSFRLARQTAIETLLSIVAGWSKEDN